MNIEQYLDELIKREGGYVNNPTDRGGQLSMELLKQLLERMDSKVICEIYLWM